MYMFFYDAYICHRYFFNNKMFKCFSTLIHFLIILLIIHRSHIFKPFFIIEMPSYSLLNAFLKLQRRFPIKFLLKLCRVNGLSSIMIKTVFYVCDKVEVFVVAWSRDWVILRILVHEKSYYV